jgi:hypothetical protein
MAKPLFDAKNGVVVILFIRNKETFSVPQGIEIGSESLDEVDELQTLDSGLPCLLILNGLLGLGLLKWLHL